MNVWVRIHDIPSALMESDSMAIQTRSSLGSLIRVVTKTDTRRINGTKVNTGNEAFEEFVHSSDEASDAIAANMVSDLPDPLDGLLNEEDISSALDILAPTPLMVVKPDGETIIEDSIAPRDTKRCSPMVATPKAKKTRNANSSANFKAGMSIDKNSPTEDDNQPAKGHDHLMLELLGSREISGSSISERSSFYQ
ncbi:hypothetical protein V6N13_072849 [Hibiscus sabdariffa]